MPKYDVVLFYHASATYTVEAEDEDAAVWEAKRLDIDETEEQFHERLNIEIIDDDYQVYEAQED
jgi:hypothetical protein